MKLVKTPSSLYQVELGTPVHGVTDDLISDASVNRSKLHCLHTDLVRESSTIQASVAFESIDAHDWTDDD